MGLNARRRVAAVALAAGLACWTVAGCSSGHRTHPDLIVDQPVALADQPVHIHVTGLSPYDQVTVDARADDDQRRQWHGWGRFTADGHGGIDLDRAQPTAGTWTGADGMGLFWSMNPPDGDPDRQWFDPPSLAQHPAYDVTLSVTSHGHVLATRDLTRQWMAAGVTARPVTLAADHVAGELFLPPAGSGRHPAVLAFGGSEGGMGLTSTAALLASRGYPTLAIAYFREAGLPDTLRDIPLEYFASAARLLAAQPSVDPGHLVALGYSRGTEAALLLGQHFPTLVHGAILYSPNASVWSGYGDPSSDAWTLAGKPVPHTQIPVDHVSGPVLTIAGADDELWFSASSASLIMRALDEAHIRYPHQALTYPGAGHNVGTFPYLAQGTVSVHPVSGATIWFGGTRPDTAAAQAQGWPKVLALLASLQSPP